MLWLNAQPISSVNFCKAMLSSLENRDSLLLPYAWQLENWRLRTLWLAACETEDNWRLRKLIAACYNCRGNARNEAVSRAHNIKVWVRWGLRWLVGDSSCNSEAWFNTRMSISSRTRHVNHHFTQLHCLVCVHQATCQSHKMSSAWQCCNAHSTDKVCTTNLVCFAPNLPLGLLFWYQHCS